MATEDSSNTPGASQLTPNEMRGLAARFRACAQSVLMKDQPEQQRDLRTAASLIELLASISTEILATAAVVDGLSRLLGLMGGA